MQKLSRRPGPRETARPSSCFSFSSMKVLKYLAVIYFISLIVLLNKTLEDALCINSITVQSINIDHGKDQVFAPSCYYETEASGIPVLGDKKLLKNLGNSVESFEAFLRNNKLFYKPNSLRILIKDSAELVITAREIQMNRAQASDLNLFRKSLLKSWLLNFSSQKIRDDKFMQEVVSDIFLYVFWNEMNWERETNFKRWLKYVYSEKDICKTDYVPSERGPFCDLITESSDFDQISIWSMRPLVVNRILYYYDDMTYKQKLEFARYWMKLTSTYDGELPEKTLSFQNFSTVYNTYMDQFVGKLLNIKFEEPLSVDYVFEFNVPQPYSMVNYKNDLPFYLTKNILFKFKDDAFINLRNGSRLVTNKSTARHWVMVQNTLPELKDVKHLPADYLTIIQAKNDYDMNQFYKKMDDISAFPWTEEFDSLTLYIPSLKLLGRLAPHSLRSSDIRSLLHNPEVTRTLGWDPVKIY